MATIKSDTATKTATTKKTTTDNGVTTTTLARELANLTEEVTSLRTEIATLKAANTKTTGMPAPTATKTATGTTDSMAHEKIENILLLLKGTCGVRDYQLTHYSLK